MSYAVRVESLTKSYGSHTVLKGLSFQVKKGEIFGVLGVNGAGKTTTLECMEGLRKYDSGKITADGRGGIQLQSASLPAFIKPMEAIQLFAKWNIFESRRIEFNLILRNPVKIHGCPHSGFIHFICGSPQRKRNPIRLLMVACS